jgi:ABC-type molybdate transport system ATPase subunit
MVILPVAFTFAVVIGLIANLDRPQEGNIRVSQQPLVDLRQSIK